jgi:putative transposase
VSRKLGAPQTLGDDDDAIAGLATLDHLKGNDRPRLLYRLRELMTQAWEELGFDLKGTSVANVHKHLAMLLHEENVLRGRNQLPMLIMPAEKTLNSHRAELLSPSEFLIATKGDRHANNKRGRGSTDVRALMIAEMAEMDECKVSLITSAKEKGYWHTLDRDFQEALELADEEIRRRLTILVMIDVATRMPLAWVVSDQPKAEATIALLRMATRDKTREKRIYGCDGDPMPALGLGLVRNDNGTGLRNKQVKEILMATAAANVDVRAYASADKPYVERMFGTAESVLWKLVHGYTGRKPGENPGYDAKKSGVLDIDQLHAIMTHFFIDEYPSMLHMGVGMGRRRPAEVYKALNKERGIFRRLDEDVRRVHLGWKFEVKPNDEGCRILSGLWYSSDELQEKIDDWPGKIAVFIDPDNLTYATAVIQGQPDLIRLTLQTTVFADLTATEFLAIMEEFKRENPETTEIYEDRLAKVRRDRFDLLKQIGVERNLPRSYSTQGEARAKAKVLFAASRIVRTYTSVDTVQPGTIMDQQDGPGVFQLGGGDVIEHFSMENSGTQSEKFEGDPPKLGKKKDVVSDGNKPERLGRPQEKGEFS